MKIVEIASPGSCRSFTGDLFLFPQCRLSLALPNLVFRQTYGALLLWAALGYAMGMANHHHHCPNDHSTASIYTNLKAARYTNVKSQTTPIHENTTPMQVMMLHQLKNYTNLLLHQSFLIGVAPKMSCRNLRFVRITSIFRL